MRIPVDLFNHALHPVAAGRTSCSAQASLSSIINLIGILSW